MKIKLSKKILIPLIIIIGFIIIFCLYLIRLVDQSTPDNFYYVGIASTLENKAISDDRNDMLQGIQLAANQVNQSGGINGKPIKLLIQNDKNDPSVAMKAASNFAKDQRILFVLGHYYSTPSLVGGDIYQKNAIPVITASATYDQITQDNEWYFRTIPNNSYYAEFIGTYMGLNAQKLPVVIITGKDDYHLEITQVFARTIHKYGIHPIEQFRFTKGRKDVSPQLIKISNTIKRLSKKCIIFISSETSEMVELVRLLKSSPRKYDYKIYATDSAATNEFARGISKFPREKDDPGYYSDNLVTLASAVPGTGNVKTFQFYKDFYESNLRMPSWVAAIYYDTFMLCMQAIQRAELNIEHSGIRKQRRQFRNALNEFYDHQHAFNGVTGNIFFDNNGDAKRPLIPAHYQDNTLIPEYVQYQRSHHQDLSAENIKQSLNNDIVVINQTVLNKKQVVFANIQILSVTPFQNKNQRIGTVDFYLKFRFSTDFDDHNIWFDNTQHPVALSTPVMEKIENGVIQRLYRVKANFYFQSNDPSFPVDQHVLPIRFHHNRITADYLTYVPSVEIKNIKLSGAWKMRSHQFSIDTVEDENIPKLTVIKENLYYTQVNTKLILSRQNHVILYVFPFLIMFLLLYAAYYVPVYKLSATIVMICATIIVNTLYYYKILSYIQFPVLIYAAYTCLFMYGLSILTLISGLSMSMCHVKNEKKMEKIVRYAGIIGYPIILGIFILWIAY
jgi:ABC-type branched-subunit amino acid transport system substrate-binding protein